jgi:hypothetical protein
MGSCAGAGLTDSPDAVGGAIDSPEGAPPRASDGTSNSKAVRPATAAETLKKGNATSVQKPGIIAQFIVKVRMQAIRTQRGHS